MEMLLMRQEKFIAAAGCAVLMLAAPATTFAENLFSLYSETLQTHGSDLRPVQSGAGLNLSNVEWSGDALRPPPAYGLRYTHFADRHPNWGVGIAFNHYKSDPRIDNAIGTDALWRGATLDQTAAGPDVPRSDSSQGVSVLSINGIYRWGDLSNAVHRLQPYVGVGLAYYRPQADNMIGKGYRDSAYEAAGVGYHLMGGLRYRVSERMGAFVEAKFNSGGAQTGIGIGGDAETSLRNFHAVAGVSYRF
jgi:opacity protein-like surface antigen